MPKWARSYGEWVGVYLEYLGFNATMLIHVLLAQLTLPHLKICPYLSKGSQGALGVCLAVNSMLEMHYGTLCLVIICSLLNSTVSNTK